MENGSRPGLLALFFVGGMIFMAALISMAPRDLLSPAAVKVVTASSPPVAFSTAPEGAFDSVEPPHLPAVEADSNSTNHIPFPHNAASAPAHPVPVLRPAKFIENVAANAFPTNNLAEQAGLARQKVKPARAAAVMEPSGRANIVRRLKPSRRVLGRVVLDGNRPPEKVISMDRSSAANYNTEQTTRFFVVGKDNSLADVVVAIAGGLVPREWPVLDKPLVLSQRGSFIEPYVSAAQAGQPIVLENLDSYAHAITVLGRNGSQEIYEAYIFSKGLAGFQPPAREDSLKIKCHFHPWEFGYVSIFNHPFFAVTGLDGRFEIHGLPPGKYMLSATHRKSHVVTREIEVRDDSSLELEIGLQANEVGPNSESDEVRSLARNARKRE